MAVKDSSTSGNWASGGTWVGGVAPGNNDVGRINAGHTVTVAVAAQAMGWVLNGGTLIFNADFTYTDTPSAGFSIVDVNSGGISSNGAPGAWRKFKSSVNPPNNPWTPEVLDILGDDNRSLNFDYIEFQGSKPFLGNDNYYVYFNDVSKGDGYLTLETINPPSRESRILEHPIKGRASAIVYPGASSSRAMLIAGRCRYTSGFPHTLDQIQTSKKRIAFFSRFWHLPKCWIDGKPIINSTKNAEVLIWNLALREDV